MRVEVATSSYRQFEPGIGVPVRITLGKPRFRLSYSYEEIRLLAPTPRIFRLGGEDFEHEYREHLEKIGVERLKTVFEEVSGRHGRDQLVLLCFENVLAGERCHRRVWADWWFEQTGQRVPELEPNAVVEQHEPAQKTLFEMEGE
ncbi:MAG: DUF488 family protein [Rubrobacter sp.]|nr:DUF488 family protein [Rubrobacter sp.]